MKFTMDEMKKQRWGEWGGVTEILVVVLDERANGRAAGGEASSGRWGEDGGVTEVVLYRA
jgi:hypothetical protein